MKKLKILVFTIKPPYPLSDGYNLRIYHYVKNLYHKHDFSLLSWIHPNKALPKDLNPLFKHIQLVRRKSPVKLPLWKEIINAFSIYNLFDYYSSVELNLKQLITNYKFDIIWLIGWETFLYIPYIKSISSMPILGDIIDDGVLFYFKRIKYSDSLKVKMLTLKNLLNFFRFEKNFFPLADKCLLVSELDAKFFKQFSPKAKIVILPNGVDIDYFRPKESDKKDESILVFEGNMAYPPNEDAAIYFCNKIFPLIKTKAPKVKFFIVGKNPSRKIKEIAKNSDIFVTGYVDDIRPYLVKASIFVCPMREGAGIKNKILQAWAMGKPVVATSASLGGLKVNIGQNIIVADNPNKFAEEVINLLGNKDKREKIGIKARETVEKYYSWQKKAQELEKIFFSLIKNA